MLTTEALCAQAQSLVDRLDARIAACYVDHPQLGRMVKDGDGRAVRRLKQVRHTARRRLNRRKHAAGMPLTVQGALWLINQADSGSF